MKAILALQDEKALRWACRRGMLELDLVLLDFLDNYYNLLKDDQKKIFKNLLLCTDPELENWLFRNHSPESPFEEIVSIIRQQSICRLA